MGMMRMGTNGKNLVCRSCLDRKPVQKQEQAKTEMAKAQKEEPETKEYFCKGCKYNFKRARHLVITT